MEMRQGRGNGGEVRRNVTEADGGEGEKGGKGEAQEEGMTNFHVLCLQEGRSSGRLPLPCLPVPESAPASAPAPETRKHGAGVEFPFPRSARPGPALPCPALFPSPFSGMSMSVPGRCRFRSLFLDFRMWPWGG